MNNWEEVLGSEKGLSSKMMKMKKKQLVKRKEKWLVILGIILHAIYMLSIFDIYFKTPIVHGMDPVQPRFSPPARRLVLLVADGLRADKFYEPDEEGNYRAPFLRSVIKEKGRWADGLRADKFYEPDEEGNYRAPFLRSVIKEKGRWADGLRADKFYEPDEEGNYRAPFLRSVIKEKGRWADGLRADKFYEPDEEGNYRAPFLRSVIKEKGRWGVSHARPPTESRPGHVAIIAGFYEDPSAVTKGWKANPVEFDSVFNQSYHTFSYGSPDIVPIFCGALPHSTWDTYPHEFEDFATDASFLDEWSFDQFQSLLNKSKEDKKLQHLLDQDNVVVFLHLLGCDSNGHAHRPFSSIYLNNVKVVDHIAERVYKIVEDHFKDNRTAYIFTADHGMSDKGSHGDGHPTNTDTPLVVWGAGVKAPQPDFGNHSGCSFRFVDEHSHDTPTPSEWGLGGIERVDVNQADITPLMSTLLGMPCPVNSVGSLPLDYINFTEGDEVEAVYANTKQILNQFTRKSYIKQSDSLFFKPFKPLMNYLSMLNKIEELISTRDFQNAMKLSEDLRKLALQGLHYFQTYDWMMLMTTVTLGYIGWIIYLIIHVLKSYTSLPGKMMTKKETDHQQKKPWKVNVLGGLFMGAFSIILLVERSPPLYHAYTAMTVFLWTQILCEYQFLNALRRSLEKEKLGYFVKLVAYCLVSLLLLELLVHSFTERKLYTFCFLIVGVVAPFYLYRAIPWRSWIPVFICVSCWCLSVFTLMPAEIPDNTLLVVISGVLIIFIGLAPRWMELHSEDNKYWLCILNHELTKPKLRMLFHLQAFLVGLSSIMVPLSTSHRTQKQQLLALHQITNWFVAGVSLVLPLFSAPSLLSRLTSIFLGFAPAFLLLSIGYEAVFYAALGLVLMAWIFFENTTLYLSEKKRSSASEVSAAADISAENEDRTLQLSDVRIPLVFMVLFNVAFFGTGNFASIASFEISSVYRFITIFSPFLMAALLIFKLFIPFMLVICAFSSITKLIRVPRLGLYFIVVLLSDVMTIHFFFLVRNTGSWMEIGNSISHFGIMSAQVVFVLLLFALTNIYTRDIQIKSPALSRKIV